VPLLPPLLPLPLVPLLVPLEVLGVEAEPELLDELSLELVDELLSDFDSLDFDSGLVEL
jgi:hypothetical protein